MKSVHPTVNEYNVVQFRHNIHLLLLGKQCFRFREGHVVAKGGYGPEWNKGESNVASGRGNERVFSKDLPTSSMVGIANRHRDAQNAKHEMHRMAFGEGQHGSVDAAGRCGDKTRRALLLFKNQ